MMAPEFIRTVEGKGRISIPACLAGLFAAAVRITLRPEGTLFVEPAAVGRPLHQPNLTSGTRRLFVPAEFRQRTKIRPGAEVAIARDGQGLLIWVWEGDR